MSQLKEKGLVAVGAVVLAVVVIWALAKKEPDPPALPPVATDAAPAVPEAAPSASVAVADAAKPPQQEGEPLPVEQEVTVELAIVAPKATAAKLAEYAAQTAEKWPLKTQDCAGDCAPLRKTLADSKATVEVMAAADWILPPKETLPTVARTVPEAERAALYDTKSVLVVHVQAENGKDHMALRAGFGLAAALARELSGYVHDEVTRRIDPYGAFAERVPKAPIGTPFFVPESIVIQLHPVDEEDVAGPYRLVSHGMARYGVPDLDMRGFHEKDGPRLALVLNTIASKVAEGERGPTYKVTLADVAKVAKKKADDLTKAASKSKDVSLTLSLAERSPADPDNDVFRIEAPGDGDEEAHAELLATLFGEARVLTKGTNDPALLAAEARARKAAPAAVAKWKASGGSLTLRVPFPVEGEKGQTEVMWMKVGSCDDAGTCKGKLASRPVFAKSLAPGADVTGKIAEVSDYLYEGGDGGKEGGETIPLLERAGR